MVPALLLESAADPEDWGFLSWDCERVVTSTNEARIAQSGGRIPTSDWHGLPLIISATFKQLKLRAALTRRSGNNVAFR